MHTVNLIFIIIVAASLHFTAISPVNAAARAACTDSVKETMPSSCEKASPLEGCSAPPTKGDCPADTWCWNGGLPLTDPFRAKKEVKLVSTAATYDDADQACQDAGGILIGKGTGLTFFETMFDTTGGCAWVGAQKQSSTSNIQWNDDSNYPTHPYTVFMGSNCLLRIFTCKLLWGCGSSFSPVQGFCEAQLSTTKWPYACGRALRYGEKLVGWERSTGDGRYEDVAVPLGATYDEANGYCDFFGAYLGELWKNRVSKVGANLTNTAGALQSDKWWVEKIWSNRNEDWLNKWPTTGNSIGRGYPSQMNKNDVPETKSASAVFDYARDVFSTELQTARLPFMCSRKLLRARLSAGTCYVDVPCSLTLFEKNGKLAKNYHKTVKFRMAFRNLATNPEPVEQTIESETSETVFTVTATSIGTMRTDYVGIDVLGWNPDTRTLDITINDKELVEWRDITTGASYFINEPFAFRLKEQTSDALTVTKQGTWPTAVTISAWKTDKHADVTTTAPATAGSYTMYFDVAGSLIYKSTTDTITITVKAQDTVTVGPQDSYLLPGMQYSQQFTSTTTNFMTNFKISAVDQSSCGITFDTTGRFNAEETKTIKCKAPATITQAKTCTLRWNVIEWDQGTPYQWADIPDSTISIVPYSLLSIVGFQSSYSTDVSYDFQVEITLYGGEVTVEPVLASATISPPSRTITSVGTALYSFTLIGTTAGTDELTFTITGPQKGDFAATQPTQTTTFTIQKLVTVSFPSEIYLQQAAKMDISEPNSLTGAETLAVTITWQGTAGSATLSSSTVTLDATTHSASLDITGVNVDSSSFGFSLSAGAPVRFSITASQALSILAQKAVVNESLPQNVSVGAQYGKTIEFSLPSLPVSGTVTIMVVGSGSSANITTEPQSISWMSAALGGVNDPRSLTVIGATPSDNATAAVSLVVNSTSPDYPSMQTFMGFIHVYQRAVINATEMMHTVYGLTSFTVTWTTSVAPVGDALRLAVTAPTADVSFLPSVDIPVGETSVSVVFTPQRSTGTSFEISIAIDTGTTHGYLVDTYVADALPVTATLHEKFTPSVSVNDAIFFFGPGVTLTLNVSVAQLSTGGQLQVTPTNQYYSFDPQANSLSSSSSQPYLIFTGSPILTETVTTDTTTQVDIGFVDSSNIYATTAQQIAITLKPLITPTVSLVTTGTLYVGSQNAFEVVLDGKTVPYSGITLTVQDTLTLTADPSTLSLSETNPVQTVSLFTTTAGTYALQFAVVGPLNYSTTSSSVSVTVRDLASVGSSVSTAVLFVGQSATLSFLLSSAPKTGTHVILEYALECSGIASPSAVTLGSAFANVTSASSSVSVKAEQVCSGGAVGIAMGAASTATIYTPPNPSVVYIDFLPLKTVSVAQSDTVLYGGGSHSIVLTCTVSGLPHISDGVFDVIATTTSGTLSLTTTTFSFFGYGAAESKVVLSSVSSARVDADTPTTITFTFGGNARTEYDTAGMASDVTFTIMPLVNLTYATTIPADGTVFVGASNMKSVSITATPPPIGAEYIDLSPELFRSASSFVGFNPMTFRLTAAEPNVTFDVEAKDTADATIKINVLASTARQYPLAANNMYIPEKPVVFKSLGTLTVSGLAGQVFLNQSMTVTCTLSSKPPSGYGTVSVSMTTCSDDISVDVASKKYDFQEGSGSEVATFVLTGAVVTAACEVTFSFAPSQTIYTATTVTKTVAVVDNRAILFQVPSFLYVNMVHRISVSIVTIPPAGQSLDVLPTWSVATQPIEFQPKLGNSLTDSTSLSIDLTALEATPTFTFYINIGGTAVNSYTQPPGQPMEVRALETVSIVGIPSEMYVNNPAEVTISVSRVPQCNSAFVTIVGAFSDPLTAYFSPKTGVTWSSTDATNEPKMLILTPAAIASTAINAEFTISSDTCLHIYQHTSSSVGTFAVKIHQTETITLSVPADASDPTAAGENFMYVNNKIQLTLDLGTPKIPHQGVSVVLTYPNGFPSSLTLPATEVVFAVGENKKTIEVEALLTSPLAELVVTVVQGKTVFFPGPAPKLKILPRIRVSVNFLPQSTLLVVGSGASVIIEVEKVALAGAMQVEFAYANTPGFLAFSPAIIFDSGSTVVSREVIMQGAQESAAALLTVTLTGPAGMSYYLDTAANYTVPVLPVKFVHITVHQQSQYLGPANIKNITVELQETPTLDNDQIQVLFASNTIVKFSVSSISLSNTQMSFVITVEGLAKGTFDLETAISVSSTSREYYRFATFTSSASSIDILSLLGATLENYISSIYINGTTSFTIRIPSAPLSGNLEITPSLAATGYNMELSPSVAVFNDTNLVVDFILKTPIDSLPLTTFDFNAAGSPEYLQLAASDVLRVIPPNQVSFSNWKTSLYIGTPNSFVALVYIKTLPTDDNHLNITAIVPPSVEISPSWLYFNASTTASYAITVTGVSPPAPQGSTELVSWSLEDSMDFYEVPAPLSIGAKSLATVSATVSGTSIYLNSEVTVTVTLSTPPTEDLYVELLLQKNRTTTQLIPLVVNVEYSRFEALKKNALGLTTLTFTAKALVAPLAIDLSVALSGAGAKIFSATRPRFLAYFLSLRPITTVTPSLMYHTLPSEISVSLSEIPATSGTVLVSLSLSSASSLQLSTSSLRWDSSSTSLTQYIQVLPLNQGPVTISYFVTLSNTPAYVTSTAPSSAVLVVNPPSFIALSAAPQFNFVGSMNKVTLTVTLSIPFTDAEVSNGETLFVRLNANTTNVIISPSVPINLALQPQQRFTIEAVNSAWAKINLTFTSSVNRFALDKELRSKGRVINFEPLKTTSVTKPKATANVGTKVSVFLHLSRVPSPGQILIAQLLYAGSQGNIDLPPTIQMDSTTATTREFTFTGKSPTSTQDMSLVLSNDQQYVLSTVQFPMEFLKLLSIAPTVPTSMFSGKSAQCAIQLENHDVNSIQIQLESTPAGALTIEPSLLTFLTSGSTVHTFTLTANTDTTATIKYVKDAGATRFLPVADSVITLFASSAVLVNVPAIDMVVYLSSDGWVEVGVELSQLPQSRTLTVTPTFTCGADGFANFSKPYVQFSPTSLTAATFRIIGIKPAPRCSLQFTSSGDAAADYKSNKNLYSVMVRDLHNITLAKPPTRVFLGPENVVSLNISLDYNTPWPLTDPIEIFFSTPSSTCITVTPNTLYWAEQSEQEPKWKTVNVEASCVASFQTVAINTTTTSNIFLNTVPSFVKLNAVPLQEVVVAHPHSGSTEFFMYVGGNSFDFDVTIPEPLGGDESLTVTAQYAGIAGSIEVTPAVWSPSPLRPVSKQLNMRGLAVSARSQLSFMVDGPPRFKQRASGQGFLEVFGPKYVIARVPTRMVAGNNYTCKVSIEDFPFPGKTVTVQPEWPGSPSAIIFDPPYLTWASNSMTLDQRMTIAAVHYSGAYTLNMKVSGSTRFVQSAFSGEVRIDDPVRITHSILPYELMIGKTYSMLVDVTSLPKIRYDILAVEFFGQKQDVTGIDCVRFSTTQLLFISSSETAQPRQFVDITAVAPCPQRTIAFQVRGNISSAYQKHIPVRLFKTIPASTAAVAWPLDAYIGAGNSVDAAIELQLREQLNATDNVTVTIIPDKPAATSCGVSCTVLWNASSASSSSTTLPQTMKIVGITPGTVTFTFVIVAHPSRLAFTLEARTTVFYDYITLQRGTLPSSIYMGTKNMQLLKFNVSALPRYLASVGALSLTVTPVTSAPDIKFQPSKLVFYPGYPIEAFLYVLSDTPVAQSSISFDVTGDRRILQNAIPAANLTVLPLKLVTFDPPPKQLYVGEANKQGVKVRVPNGVWLNLTVVVDGEAAAIAIPQATLTWSVNTAREQEFVLIGVFGTPRVNRLRYIIADGPPWVTLAPMNPLDTVTVLSLLPVSRVSDPTTMEFSIVEMDTHTFDFTPPHLTVNCHVSDVYGAKTTDINITDYGNKTIVRPLIPGDFVISCSPTDTRYRSLYPFTIRSSMRKLLSITQNVMTFVGVARKIQVSVDRPPSFGAIRVEFLPTPYAKLFPTTLFFTAQSSRSFFVICTGLNETNGQPNLPILVTGPIGEYRLNEASTVVLEVVPRVKLTYQLSSNVDFSRRASPADPVPMYEQPQNQVRITFTLSNHTLNGPVQVTPIPSGSGAIIYSLTVLSLGSTLSRAVVFYSVRPTGSEPIRFRVVGPTAGDYDGASEIFVDYLRFYPLEKVTVDVNSLPATLFTGTGNVKQLTVSLSGYPNPNEKVEVALRIAPQLSASPLFLSWTHDPARKFGVAPSAQSFIVAGMQLTSAAAIEVIWRDAQSVAGNFDKTIVNKDITTSVSNLYGFKIYDAAMGALPTFITLFPTSANAAEILVVIDGLPLISSFTEVATVSIKSTNETNVGFNKNSVSFGKQLNGASLKASFKVYSLRSMTKNETITLTLSGPPEYGAVVIAQKLVLLPYAEFETRNLPTDIAIGPENAKSFYVRPKVPSTLNAEVFVTCGEVSFSADEELIWKNDMTWKKLTLAASLATASTTECIIKTIIGGGSSAKLFRPIPLEHRVRSFLRPEVLFTPIPEVSAEVIRSKGLKLEFRLTGKGKWKFAQTQIYVPGSIVPANDTFAITASKSMADEPRGTAASIYGSNTTQFLTYQVKENGDVLEIALGPMEDYAPSVRETVTVEIRRKAIDGDIALQPNRDKAVITIRGSKEALIGGVQQRVISSTANVAVATGGAMSLGSATQAGKLQAIINAFICPNPEWRDNQDDLDWNEHPLKFLRLGSNRDLGVYAAVGVGNAMIICGVAALHLFIAVVVYYSRANKAFQNKTFSAARATVRFPSYLLFPTLFFYQPCVTASLKTIMYSPLTSLRFVGAVCFIGFGFGLPLFMYAILGPGFKSSFEDAPPENFEGKSMIRRIFMPHGRWTHPNDKWWVLRYGMFFDEFRGGFERFMCFDVILVFVLGVVEGIEPLNQTQCMTKTSFTILLFLVQFLVILWKRPYIIGFQNLFFIVAYFCQFLSMLLIGIAAYRRDPNYGGIKISIYLIFTFAGMLVVKTISDAVMICTSHIGLSKLFEEKEEHRFRDTAAAMNEEDEVDKMREELKEALLEKERARAQREATARHVYGGEQQDGNGGFSSSSDLSPFARLRQGDGKKKSLLELDHEMHEIEVKQNLARLRRQREEQQQALLNVPLGDDQRLASADFADLDRVELPSSAIAQEGSRGTGGAYGRYSAVPSRFQEDDDDDDHQFRERDML